LREENLRDKAALGPLFGIFQGSEYATIGNATAAYMAARSLTHPFGVGFVGDDGQYQLIQVEPGAESGFDGTTTLTFDKICTQMNNIKPGRKSL